MATTITANGINFPDGSAGSPSIGGTDTNTGLFTGSDIVGFATGGSERLRIDASGNVNIANDSGKLQLGTSADLQIYHNGTDSYITDAGTGRLMLLSNGFQVNSADNSEIQISAVENSAVNLYFNGSKKIETTANGVTVTGGVTTTGGSNFAGTINFTSSGSGIRCPHTSETDTNDGTIAAGVFSSGLNIVGVQTGAGLGRQIRTWGNFFPSNNATEECGTATQRWGKVNTDKVFFNGETADANGLGDYEEGTWTPSIVNGWGILNPTYDEQVGLYVRIGKIVHVLLRIDLSGGSTNGNRIAISNFPFTPATIGSTGYVALNGYCDSASSNAQSIFCMVGKSGTTAEVFHRDSTGESSFTGTELGNTGQMNFSGTFTTT